VVFLSFYTQVIGDKDTTVTVRYKEGKNLTVNEKHAMFESEPHKMGLPRKNIVDNFIFAKANKAYSQ